MEAVRSIQPFQLGKDRSLPLLLGEEPAVVAQGQFGLQRREETLGDGMVPTIPPRTHRALDLPGGKPLLIRLGGIILTALIGNDAAPRW